MVIYVQEIAEYRKIVNHIRTTLLDCDMMCESCSESDKAACIADMKTSIYDLLGMIEQLYTLIGIVAGKVMQPREPEEPPDEKEVEMFV